MSILGRTILSKFYRNNRGKALAIAGMGHPAAEVIFPTAVVFALSSLAWREVWFAMAALILLVFLPIFLICLRQMYRLKPHELEENERDQSVRKKSHGLQTKRNWEVKEVLRDSRLYLYLPGAIFPPFVLTGLVFHHHYFVLSKGWTMEFIAKAFVAYGVSHAVLGIIAGPLVDRFSAQRLVPFFLLPLLMGVGVFLMSNDENMSILYLALCGACVGLGHTIKPALFPEIYGTKNLGAIASTMSSIMVFSTAAAPPIFGFALEYGILPADIMRTIIVAGILASILMLISMRASIRLNASPQDEDRPGLDL